MTDLDADGARKWDEKLRFTAGAGIPDEFGGVRSDGTPDSAPTPTSVVTQQRPPGSHVLHVPDAKGSPTADGPPEPVRCPVQIGSPVNGVYPLEQRCGEDWEFVVPMTEHERTCFEPLILAFPKLIRLAEAGVPKTYSQHIGTVCRKIRKLDRPLNWHIVRPGPKGKGRAGGGEYGITVGSPP